jgi:ribose/xylose/arabinose/galactoside ABC-type transport system permease subunit
MTAVMTAESQQVPVTKTARSERIAALAQRHGALAVLLIAIAVASLVFDSFATFDNVTGISIQSSFLVVVALGMTFVIITGGIDLSVGSVFALGGVVAAWASQYGFVPALLAPLLVCGAVGLVNGLVIAYTGLAPFIVTLAGLLGARGLLLAITDEGAETYLVPRGAAFLELGRGTFLGFGYPVWIAVLLCVLGGVLLQRTRYGQGVYAIGGSADAAALMGLPVARITVLTYLLSGLLAGLAGALNAARLGSGVTILGVGLELDAIAAVVIGGTLLIGGAGTVSGTLCGVLLLGVIQNVINQIGNLTSSVQSVVSGAFLVVVVVTQSYLSRVRRLR